MTDFNTARLNLEQQLVDGAPNTITPSKLRQLILELIDALAAKSSPFSKVDASTDPTVDDDGVNSDGNGFFVTGSRWYNQVTDEVYLCLINTTGAAVWVPITLSLDDLGSAATLNAGAGANELLQMGPDGKLPAADASKLTNLPMPSGLGVLAELDEVPDESITAEKIPNGEIPAEKLANDIIGNSHWVNDAQDIPTDDWNDVVTSGFWKAHNKANAPSAGIWWGGIVFAHNSNYVTQLVFDYTNITSKRLYMRYKINGTWGAWEKVSVDRKTVPTHYMKFEGTNGAIHYESGFATLTRTGTGRYTCTFATPEPDTNYEVWCDLECGSHTLPFRFDARARNYSTTGFDIVVGEQNEGAWAYKDELVFVHVYRRT